MNRDEAKALIESNQRSIQLLDRRILDLERMVGEEEERYPYEDAKEYPYFYGVKGVDGQEGILLGDIQGDTGVNPAGGDDTCESGVDNPKIFEGIIQIQEDAPFVWTHLMTTINLPFQDRGVTVSGNPIFTNIQKHDASNDVPGGGGTGARLEDYASPNVEIGFIENGSGRVLFQADRQRQVGELLSVEMFNTQRVWGQVNQNNSGAYALGHGPNLPFELPAEVVLPLSGTLTVQAKPSYYNFKLGNQSWVNNFRLYVTLLGYKIFED